MNLSPENQLQQERTQIQHDLRRAIENVDHWKLKKYAAETREDRLSAAARLLLWQSDERGQRKRLREHDSKHASGRKIPS